MWLIHDVSVQLDVCVKYYMHFFNSCGPFLLRVCEVDYRRMGPFYGLPVWLQVNICTQISTTVYITTLTEMTDCKMCIVCNQYVKTNYTNYFMLYIRSMMLHVLQWSSTKASIYNSCDIVFVLIMSYIQHPTIMALHYYNITCSVDHDIDVRSIHTQHIFTREQGLCPSCLARHQEWEQDILSQLTPGSDPGQTNPDKPLWEREAWEIAKVWMGPSHESFRAGGGDTIALLQLVTNCRLFASSFANRQSFVDVSSEVLILQ